MKQKFQRLTGVKRVQLQALCKDFELTIAKSMKACVVRTVGSSTPTRDKVNSVYISGCKPHLTSRFCGVEECVGSLTSTRDKANSVYISGFKPHTFCEVELGLKSTANKNHAGECHNCKILWLMTTVFNYIVCFIEESNMEAMTIDELQSNLVVHEQRMMLAVEEQFMQIVTDEKSLTCFTLLLIFNSPLVLTGSWNSHSILNDKTAGGLNVYPPSSFKESNITAH
ncbi:hypothetical protein V8G54_002373 [Vigna mungo]|uniref:Uncharacterized protein n=1 Tax=Vigna mungo TaxID=3915 RepID=A0AAQ3S923_VIGMU